MTTDITTAIETLREMKGDLAHGMSVQGYREGTMKRLLDDFDAALTTITDELARLRKALTLKGEATRQAQDAVGRLRADRDEAVAALRGDWEQRRTDQGWPTPNHMRNMAESLDRMVAGRYGSILRFVADLCDAALSTPKEPTPDPSAPSSSSSSETTRR